MAYNKDNYENNRLTPNQEKFVDNIMQGKTQYESYILAYPRAKKWTRNAIDVAASQLMDNNKIIIRLKELGYKDKKKVEWTRKKALETINYVMDMNKQDIERINDACQTEIDLLEAKLLQKGNELADAKTPREMMKIAGEMQEMTETIAKLKKRVRVNATNVHGIYEGAKILNRMFGFDITKVEVRQEDTETDNLKELSVEELKSLAYASKSGNDGENTKEG